MNIKKVIKSGLWYLMFTIFAKIIFFYNKVYLTRKLSVFDYGLFVSMFSLMSMIFTFNSLGLSSSMVKFIPEFKLKKQYGKIKSVILSIIKFELISRIIIFLILYKLSPLISKYYFKADVSNQFRFFCILILVELFSRNLKPFYKSFKNTVMLGLIDFFNPILYLLFFVMFFKFNNSIYVPILSYILTSIIIGVVFGLLSLRLFNIFKYKSVSQYSIFKKMLSFGLPLMIANTGGMFISYFDTLMLTTLSTLDNVAIYNIALQSALILSYVFSAVSITLIPTVSELSAAKKHNDIVKGLKQLYKYTLLVLIPIAFMGIILSKFLLSLVYGKEYAVGYIPFSILLIGVIFIILNNYNIRVLIGTGNTKKIAKVTWLSAITNIVLNIPFIMWWGIVGAAIATSISYIVQMILTLIQVNKIGK